MADRYKAMGLEMLPSKHYKAGSKNPRAGFAWVYKTSAGVVALICDGRRLLCGASQGLLDVRDWDSADLLQDLIIDCAEQDFPIPEALKVIRREWGDPDFEVDLEDVNQSAGPIRRALGLDPLKPGKSASGWVSEDGHM